MRMGINGSAVMLTGGSLEAVADHAKQAAADGFASYWLNQASTGGGMDALTTIVVAASSAPGIEFGTAIIPTYPRHPSALAGQAATTHAAIGGRLTLGIGLSHKPVVEGGLGMSYARPIRYMREYLTILQELLQKRQTAFKGELLSCEGELSAPPGPTPPVIVAALGPQMLRLTGRLAEGTILWLVGTRTCGEHITPEITQAAERAGRPVPRIIASLPVCVTDEPDPVKQGIGAILARYNELPAYRAMLDREGAAGPADVAVVGNEASVRAQLQGFADAGATDFAAVEFTTSPDEQARTRTLLKELAAGT